MKLLFSKWIQNAGFFLKNMEKKLILFTQFDFFKNIKFIEHLLSLTDRLWKQLILQLFFHRVQFKISQICNKTYIKQKIKANTAIKGCFEQKKSFHTSFHKK